MLAALIGKKIGMTQVYDEAGVLHPVTVIQAEPNTVLQVKTEETDGYNAVQLGAEDVKPHRSTMPLIGHAAKAGTAPKRFCREVRLVEAPDVEVGATLDVESFEGVNCVDVVATSKGKGFAGTMKRHNFKGQQASHGVKRKHRSPGSISSHGSDLGGGGNVKKGKRMSGHMGNVRTTTRHHKLVGIDKDNHLLLIKGSVPGANGGMVFVKYSKTAKGNRS
jgi:large subunit ribosomal protein L3